MKIAIGSDHAGYLYKQAILQHLLAAGHEVEDFGTHSEAPVDYPASPASTTTPTSSLSANA